MPAPTGTWKKSAEHRALPPPAAPRPPPQAAPDPQAWQPRRPPAHPTPPPPVGREPLPRPGSPFPGRHSPCSKACGRPLLPRSRLVLPSVLSSTACRLGRLEPVPRTPVPLAGALLAGGPAAPERGPGGQADVSRTVQQGVWLAGGQWPVARQGQGVTAADLLSWGCGGGGVVFRRAARSWPPAAPACAPWSPQPPPPAGPAAEAASWAPGGSPSSPGCVLLRCTRDTPGCYLTAPSSPAFSLAGLLSDDAGKRQEDPQDLRGQVGQSPRHREGGSPLGSHSTPEELESFLSSSVIPHALGRPAPAQPRLVLLIPALPTLSASSQSCSAHPSPTWQCPG